MPEGPLFSMRDKSSLQHSPIPYSSHMVLREKKIDVDSRPTTDITLVNESTEEGAPRTGGLAFWLVMLTLCVCAFLSALELVSKPFDFNFPHAHLDTRQTCVATALPTIIEDLHGQEFIWAASAYALACTATIPLGGDMAEVIVVLDGIFAGLIGF